MQQKRKNIMIFTAVKKQSITPLYTVGLFIILVFITSAGVPIVAATKPEEILEIQQSINVLGLTVNTKLINPFLDPLWA